MGFYLGYVLDSFYLFIYLFLLLFKYSCVPFPATIFTIPPTPHLPLSILPTFGFVHGSFVHVPWCPFPFFPLLLLYALPSGSCQFVLYFNVSLVFFFFYALIYWWAFRLLLTHGYCELCCYEHWGA